MALVAVPAAVGAAPIGVADEHAAVVFGEFAGVVVSIPGVA